MRDGLKLRYAGQMPARRSERDYALAPFVPIALAANHRMNQATHIRGVFLATSVRALRDHGLFDAYTARVSPQQVEEVRSVAISTWVPMEVALRHYSACDTLDVSDGELVSMGAEVIVRGQGSFLRLLARVAESAGATPVTLLEQAPRIYGHIFLGGSIGVRKVGPREMRFELTGWPLARFRYCRHGVRGGAEAVAQMLCRKAHTRIEPAPCDESAFAFQIGWT
jgi:hypothetical protein